MLAAAIETIPGWSAVTDVETAIGVVPLVAIGPGGAITMQTAQAPEVRSLADVPERALIHAWAQARHVERRRLGAAVTPVLLLEATGFDGVGGRRRGVHVLPPGTVLAWLRARPILLADDDVTLLRRRLDDGGPLPFAVAA